MNITEFLLARLDEQESQANPLRYLPGKYGGEVVARRLLADCNAKRRIIRDAEEWIALGDRAETTGMQALARFTRDTTVLRHLAAVYADHPDYREEWTL